MALIPSMLLKRLYTYASLENTEDGVRFSIKNRLSDAKLTAFHGISIDDKEVAADALSLDFGDGQVFSPDQINSGSPIDFPLRKEVFISAQIAPLENGSTFDPGLASRPRRSDESSSQSMTPFPKRWTRPAYPATGRRLQR